MDISEKLKTCIEIESKAAKIYKDLSRLFPEAETLFEEIAIEEVNHSVILRLVLAYYEAGKLPPEMFAPLSPFVVDALDFLLAMDTKVSSGKISLDEALSMSLAFEASLVEKYLINFMTVQDSDVVAKLKRMLFDTGLHLDKIKEFMRSRG